MRAHNIAYHFYADDSQIYLAFSRDSLGDQVEAFSRIEACADDVRTWMYQNKLKLNDDKTVLMVLGNKPQMEKLVFDSVTIGDAYISSIGSTTNLGAGFDSEMSMKYHIQMV